MCEKIRVRRNLKQKRGGVKGEWVRSVGRGYRTR